MNRGDPGPVGGESPGSVHLSRGTVGQGRLGLPVASVDCIWGRSLWKQREDSLEGNLRTTPRILRARDGEQGRGSHPQVQKESRNRKDNGA